MGNKNRFHVDIMAMHPEVTGSCNLVIVKLPDGDTIRFVVDCGLFQEKDYEEFNSTLPFEPENLDFCIVTHNHVDHIGRLPLMVKEGFYGPILATEATCKLMPLALYDCYKVLKDVYKRKNQKNLYSEENVKEVKRLLEPCEYREGIELTENIRVTFLKNGHLMGAALVLVQVSYPGYDSINLLFTGDYNNKNIFFDVDQIPEWILDLPLTVIQEATYGEMDSTDIEECFKDNVLKCLKSGGTVIAPVFSLGRTQEILYVLKQMQDEGVLDVGIPIYLDGKLAIKYTNLYLRDGLHIKEDMKEFLPKNITFVDDGTRGQIVESKDVKIILTTSGMGSYGPAQVYIPQYIKREKCLIHFTGYAAEGTLGDRLQQTEIGDTVEIGGVIAKKLADVKYTAEYSAHAKADEMIAFLKEFKDLKLVLVNHGEVYEKEVFAERIVDEVNPKDVGILGRKYFFRVNPYGLVKTLSTKFE